MCDASGHFVWQSLLFGLELVLGNVVWHDTTVCVLEDEAGDEWLLRDEG